ncbi:hypothetical protein [Methylorubrum extorquens]
MMMKRLVPLALAIPLAYEPVLAQQVLPPGQIDAAGNLKLGPVTLGRRQNGKLSITPDTLQILGHGSTGDASALTATVPLTGGTPVALSNLLPALYGRNFGALPNTGLDMTAALNRALSQAFESRRPLVLERGYYGVTQSGVGSDNRPYALLSKAVDLIGLGANAIDTVIYPLAGTANNVDILRVEAPANLGENFSLRNFMIDPSRSGTKYGGVGIYMVNLEGGNLSKALIENIRVKPGNDYSLYIKGTPTVATPQGAMANSQILRSMFDDGIKGEGVGDNVLWSSVVFRTSSTTRAAVEYTVTNYNPNFPSGIANLASIQVFENCNFGSLGPAILLHNGRHYVFENSNIEIGNEAMATGGLNGAMIDARGDVGPIVRVEFKGGHMGIFGSTTTATKFFRIDNVQNFVADGATLSMGRPGAVGVGFDITANARDTVIRAVRTNNPAAFASFVNDNGIGTMGVRKALPLVNGVTNVGGGVEAAGFTKTEDGFIRMYGVVSPGPGSPKVIAHLPPGFRPSETKRIGIVLQSGKVSNVELYGDGSVFYAGSTNEPISLNSIVFQNDPVISEIMQAR